jgi:hypothetical protein
MKRGLLEKKPAANLLCHTEWRSFSKEEREQCEKIVHVHGLSDSNIFL